MGPDLDQIKMAEGLSWKAVGSCAENPFVLALDVGTTTIRCHIYDKHAHIKGSGFRKVCIHCPSVSDFSLNPVLAFLRTCVTFISSFPYS